MHTDAICLLINCPPEVVGEGRGARSMLVVSR